MERTEKYKGCSTVRYKNQDNTTRENTYLLETIMIKKIMGIDL